MFTYPIYSSNITNPVDYLLFVNAGETTINYKSVDTSSGDVTTIHTTAPTGVGNPSLASDGVFLFLGDAGQVTRQYEWTGSTFAEVYSATPSGFTNTAERLYCHPTIPNRLIHSAIDSYASGVGLTSYESSATYSYTVQDTALTSAENTLNRYREGLYDLRKPSETEGYGSIFVSLPSSSGRRIVAFEASTASTLSVGTVVVAASVGGKLNSCDRSSGVVVITTGTGAGVATYSIDTTTLAATSIGTGTLNSTPTCGALVNDVLVTADTGGLFRTYTRSGANWTQANTLSIGSGGATADMYVSPYTDHVYFSDGTSSHCLKVLSDGSITSIATPGIGGLNTNYRSLVFVKSAF